MTGNEIKQRRQEMGLTQPDVVKALRERGYTPVDVSLLSKIESNYVLPTPHCDVLLKAILQAPESDDGAEAGQGDGEENKAVLEATQRLAEVIPFGRENAIRRATLAAKLGVRDREARRLIELARRGGLVIISEQNGRGYYQTDDTHEMLRQYIQDTNRALSILRRRKPLRKALLDRGVALK